MSQHNFTLFLIIFSIYGISAAIQLFYYLYFYLPLHTLKPPEREKTKRPVSIIICARNEADNLDRFLPTVLGQDYPDYEVIVVNDCSEDNSYEVLGRYLVRYPHLRISNIYKDPKFTHNKKFAQFIGIKASRHDILLFTDADCRPESDKWLAMMVSHFDDKRNIVLGYGGYLSGNTLLNCYIRFDSMTIGMQYLGMAIRGLPYMGVGRNLAYHKSIFFRNKGYGAHNHLMSGDDDLFINTNARGNNTCVEFRKEAHTRSVPASSVKEWIRQKKRHLTTAPYYKQRDKLLLITEPASRMSFYLLFILLIASGHYWQLTSAVFLVRLITQIFVLALAGKKLNEQGLLKYSLIFDIFSPVINGILFLSGKLSMSGKNTWK
jgi:cellulose synthase/poly-beta-1,6-N-acetylglucosamine synthase-like glycosyltransferase